MTRLSVLVCCLALFSAAVMSMKLTPEEMEERKEIVRKPYKPRPQPTSCKELNKCCQGKDNSCRIKLDAMPETDGEKKDLAHHNSSSACFCDSACLVLGDCCSDYHDFCAPVDCVVAKEWTEWGECDVKCGSGIKERTRKILQKPLNGGKPCPVTVEKIPCEGINCKQARASLLRLRDTAHLISARYGPWRISREYHPRMGIRKNLFDHYNGNVTERPSYCIVFQLTQVFPGCNESASELQKLGFEEKDVTFFSTNIVKGGQVCVECQDTAMKSELGDRCSGEGALNKETRWSITPGCRGKWKMISRQEQCTCGVKTGENDAPRPNFLFV